MGILKLYGSIILACAFYFAIDNASAISLVDDTPIPKNLDSLAKEYNNTGVDYLLEGNHEMASELFVKSLRIRESIPNFPKDRLANGYLNLAILKQDMSYIDSALIYYRKAESILLSMDNPPSSTLGISYYAFGDCLTHKQDYKSAIAYIQNGIALLGQDSLANSFHLVLASIKLSAAYRGVGMLDDALEAAQNALSMSKRYNRVYYSNALSAMGLTYMGMKNYLNALGYFKNVEEEIISGDKWRPLNLMALYSNLGTTHEYTGQYELANKYFLKGIRIAEESNSFSPQLGILLRNYALFLNSRGDLDGAERQVKEEIKEEKLSTEMEFFNHFKSLEGKSFLGKEVFVAEGVSSWADLELVMTVRECHDTIVYIPFRVGENTSRTWMVIMENGEKLRFRHDHRHEDGTPEDLTMYGGYALDGGTPFKQIFPADEFTCTMLERICDNEWSVEFSDDLSTYSYSLRKEGNLVIQVDFDLTKPL